MATKPELLICATPVYGHVMPLRAIARALIKHGYNVTFLTGSDYKTAIESIGATFVSLHGDTDLTESKIAASHKGISPADPAGLQDQLHMEYFVEVIPEQFEGLQRALKVIHGRKTAEQTVVVLVEGVFRGALPGLLGAKTLPVAGYVGVGIVPIALSSVDTAPFGPGNPPDSSPEGQRKNAVLNKENQEVTSGESQKRFNEILKNLGAKELDMFMRDANYWHLDRFVQMCAPGFEYPRSDAPDTIVFAGGLPPGLRDPLLEYPHWWSDITKKANKKTVFVAQGTISMDPNDLIVPTMLALENNSDIIVVVALGKKGATLPEGTPIPSNARIADFIPYDEMLEYTDVFVTNAGYGAVQHGLGHGVPQIAAGIVADKAENAARVEWSGVGVNLKTDKPSPGALKTAVMEILGSEKYKQRARQIQEEMQSFDPIGVVIESIEAVNRS